MFDNYMFGYSIVFRMDGFGFGLDVLYPMVQAIPEDLSDPTGPRTMVSMPGYILLLVGPLSFQLDIFYLGAVDENK